MCSEFNVSVVLRAMDFLLSCIYGTKLNCYVGVLANLIWTFLGGGLSKYAIINENGKRIVFYEGL